MRERPILFSDAMVRAILDGRKTETRRVATPLPRWGADGRLRTKACPYGAPGDLLYVREAFADVHPCQIGQRASTASTAGIPGPPPVACRIIYRADGPYPSVRHIPAYPWREVVSHGEDALPGCRGDCWRPSIHMPKWASRIWLRVDEVRLERLQDITTSAIRAEGVELEHDMGPMDLAGICEGESKLLRQSWITLWDGINAGRGYPWASNPWVWVVRFEVASTNGRPS